MTTVGTAIAEQFARAWTMLRSAISNFPAEQWRAGDDAYLIPSRLAYHAVETADFYSRETPEDFPWGQRFGVDWAEASPEQLPTQEQILAYLDDVQPKLDAWLRKAQDTELMAENTFPWAGRTVLERMLYALRHTQHHIAELNLILRQRDLPSAEWK